MPETAQEDTLHTLLSKFTFTLPLLFIIAGMLALFVLYMQISHPHRYLAADSYTYFTMARQFADSGLIYSYSGVDHTTGVHPGYYFLLLPFYPLLGHALPEWSFVINAVLLFGGLFLCYRAFGLTVAAVMFVCMELVYGASSSQNGMESSLFFLGLCAIAYVLSKIEKDSSVKWALLLGCTLSLALFSRLDSIFFAAALYAVFSLRYLYIHGWGGKALFSLIKTMALISVPLFATLAVIFAINLHYDGTLLPLSGSLKSSLPHIYPGWQNNLGVLLKMFVVAIPFLGAYLALRAYLRRPLGVLVPALLLSCVVLYLYNALFTSGIGAWYWTLPFFAVSLTAGFAVRDFIAERMFSLHALLTGVYVFLVVGAAAIISSHLARSVPDWISPHIEAAHYLAEVNRPGERAAEFKDGVFAFYSPIPVFNLPGLANNREYAEAQREGRLEQYTKQKNIVYIVGGIAGSGIQVPGAKDTFTCPNPGYDAGGVQISRITGCTVTAL